MSAPVAGYSNWHPRRLPDRPSTPDGARFTDRPPTPMFGLPSTPRDGPRPPTLVRTDSQQSLLTLQLEPPVTARRPYAQTLHQRAHTIAQRVPLPQGLSLVVAACTTVAFILSVTTLIIGLHNRKMLVEATEARHDPHGPLADMIYTVVVHALQANLTHPPGPPPIDSIVPDPN